jgi:hypothetical protein
MNSRVAGKERQRLPKDPSNRGQGRCQLARAACEPLTARQRGVCPSRIGTYATRRSRPAPQGNSGRAARRSKHNRVDKSGAAAKECTLSSLRLSPDSGFGRPWVRALQTLCIRYGGVRQSPAWFGFRRVEEEHVGQWERTASSTHRIETAPSRALSSEEAHPAKAVLLRLSLASRKTQTAAYSQPLTGSAETCA